MRVVTTCHREGLAQYGQRWLDSRRHWPNAEFFWYTEGYELPHQADELQAIETCGLSGTALIQRRDLASIQVLKEWRTRHAAYVPPDWRFDVLKYANKVFAAVDALRDYDGIGVWLDADCVTYKPIPEGLIERQVAEHYLACYQRTGLYTETGLWIVDCAHEAHKEFCDFLLDVYLTDKFKALPQWHDCFVMDAAIKRLDVPVNNLSGEFHKHPHPQALSELGKYIDHCKGPRKASGASPENAHRKAA